MEIVIRKTKRGGFDIIKGNKKADDLNYEEALGLISSLIMPEKRPNLGYLKTKEQRQQFDGMVKDLPKVGDIIFGPLESKDGDILSVGDVVFIQKGGINKLSETQSVIFAHVIVSTEESDNLFTLDGRIVCSTKEIKIATKEKSDKLFSTLNEKGFHWDANKKEILPNKWKPLPGEDYFVVAVYGPIRKFKWGEDPELDEIRFNCNCIFKTEKEAAERVLQIINILKQ